MLDVVAVFFSFLWQLGVCSVVAGWGAVMLGTSKYVCAIPLHDLVGVHCQQFCPGGCWWQRGHFV